MLHTEAMAAVRIGRDPAILDAALAQGAGLAIWQRPPDPAVAAELRRGLPPVNLRLTGNAVALGMTLDRTAADPSSWRGLAGVPALLADMRDLLGRSAGLARETELELRLETVTGDACWKFHRDMVGWRLLTTYAGPATEYVPARCADIALRQQQAYRGPLERMRPFDVALFHGVRGAGNDAVVHRSPPIAGSGRTRLLFCITDRGWR